MRAFGTILVIMGGILFFLYFLLWTLEEYNYEKISMWPIFIWIFIIFVGTIFMRKQTNRTRF